MFVLIGEMMAPRAFFFFFFNLRPIGYQLAFRANRTPINCNDTELLCTVKIKTCQ